MLHHAPVACDLDRQPCVPPSCSHVFHLQPFGITAQVAETGAVLGTFAVGPFSVPAGSEKAKLKVKVCE